MSGFACIQATVTAVPKSNAKALDGADLHPSGASRLPAGLAYCKLSAGYGTSVGR